MKIAPKYSLLLSLLTILLLSCKTANNNKNNLKQKGEITYAKGFDIQKDSGFIKIIIKNPYPNANKHLTYLLNTPQKGDGNSSIKTPIQKIVVTSTTHIPMLELLGVEQTLVGFQNTKYVSSKKTRKLIEEGYIKELGKEANLNTEILFELQPDLVVGFSMSKTNKTYTFIEDHGIPVILNGDWLEETPLGRAEWIKFFGVLYNKEKEADSIFKNIERNYLEAKAIALKAETKPTVLSGAIMSKDIWNLPAGESFVAQFLKDANVSYLWEDSKGKGSLSLSFESVFAKGQQADYWIAPGYFASKTQMLQSNEAYKNFKSFKQEHIYTPSTKTGATGGVIYFELAPTRPDLVLKDIIKITHPELLPHYELTFFEKMK